MNCFLTRWLWVSRWLPLTESFRGVIIFFPIYTSYESSFENGLRVFIITFEISLHTHLQNVLKYDYLIMETKEAICLTWFWKPFFDINARALLRGLVELEVAGEGTWDAKRRMKTIEIACIFPNPFEQRYQAKITAIKWKFDFYSIIVKAIKLHYNLVPADHSWNTCYNIISPQIQEENIRRIV